MKSVVYSIGFILINLAFSASAQDTLYHFWFNAQSKSQIDKLSTAISIDNVDGTRVDAYANRKEFEVFKSFNLPYSFITESKSTKALTMATTIADMANWDRYPTYEVYEQMMQNFAQNYPEICQLVEIGTLASGRKLWAVKISDQVENSWDPEPQLWYSGTIHGDELGGYVLLLRLIDYLLAHYQDTDYPEVTQLINASVVWINPLANPDGTYKGGNYTVTGASRYNANYVDLNRNFPDPAAGPHPDGNVWQEETQFMMSFAENHPFSLAANFHSGAEVVNYPWDTWSRITADDAWWRYVGGNYRDSAQVNGPDGYFTDVSDGLTNGFAWYRITGGRQDYMNYFRHCREVTLEIAGTKFYPTESLNTLWAANQSALVYYLREGLFGIQGMVTDAKGIPLAATIEVLNHDFDQSQVFTNPLNGHFARYLKAGTYSIKITSEGYADYLLTDLQVADGQPLRLNIIMQKPQTLLCFEADSLQMTLEEDATDTLLFLLSNCGNKPFVYTLILDNENTNFWVKIQNQQDSILAAATDTLKFIFDAHSLNIGTYFSNLTILYEDTINLPMVLKVVPKQSLAFSNKLFTYRLAQRESLVDEFSLTNTGDSVQTIELESTANWLTFDTNIVAIPANEQAQIHFAVNSQELQVGYYTSEIFVSGNAHVRFPIQLLVDTVPLLRLHKQESHLTVLKNTNTPDTLVITNRGGGIKTVSVQSSSNWITTAKDSLYLTQNSSDTVIFQIQAEDLSLGTHQSKVTLSDATDTLFYSIHLFVDTFPNCQVEPDSLQMQCPVGEIAFDSLQISNTGGGELPFQLKIMADLAEDFQLQPSEGTLTARETAWVRVAFDGRMATPGIYHPMLTLNENPIPLTLEVVEPVGLGFSQMGFSETLMVGEILTDTLVLHNTGGATLSCQISLASQSIPEWIQLSTASLQIASDKQASLVLTFDATKFPPGLYQNHLAIQHKKVSRFPITMRVLPSAKK
ncbi:MAG TPA: hypothetical protein DCQ26_18650 [Marinilabiliales bacterium]|nr:MAG: hypothetical protein A2W84_02530 [Bacteroidetes bacterium GWC2_40_13]OFX75605.1 MAG: hypothetical protein A2W96_08990 [Bacteroidetes bacterium GWD2_40_43]OFX90677.1 MAG: hypothetical protein A2W97_02805 [Bacteroidetes bacterium GWE2_40_63]OFY20845.1 MAG: hypothetical protein A2W88_17460 [Bacteroidetes bacterium GWF2_40_13]OFZ23735.1 MAG: hypothetical protein A2437_06795 [Bacteroidetes bacterium RIFOXYC2_FULL_40_12]HAN00619.1 hypothetical protein [Marinilabiliales bacterium]